MTNFLTRQARPRLIKLISIIALFIFMPFLIYASREIAILITRASGIPASIVVNADRELETLDLSFYHAFTQGGEEKSDMLKPILSSVGALKPAIIRIDHLYDYYDVVGKSGGNLTFSWNRLDEAVNTIISSGAKPLLAISYMPQSLAKDGNIINQPDDWNDWAIVVQKTIEHFSGKSQRNISGIYYEVWNEPDLSQFGSWKYYGEKNYLTLYKYASVGANNASNVNQFYLGGPGTTGLYKEWILALVKSGYRIDFFSWHTFQRDPLKFANDQEDIISWLLPYPKYTLLPILITESGFTGDKSSGYGTLYAAAHTASVIRRLISGGPKYLFSFELKDGPNQQSGDGWGLMTHEYNGSVKKPRYWIYSFIDTMSGKRLSLSGEGTWVTGFASKNNGIIRVLLVNFDVNGTHSETVPVIIGGLTPGSYSYRQKLFLGKDITRTEIISETSLEKQILMPSSGIMLLELTRN